MKTEQSINSALATYNAELKANKEKLADLEVWIDSSQHMRNAELFIAQMKRVDMLEKRIAESEFRVKFAGWVLDTEQAK